jgi:methylenetetrahydrofolate dehydrogenase (NADP+)/methenyltetrahydrofolate cyclohydrolase
MSDPQSAGKPRVIDGRALAQQYRQAIAARTAALRQTAGSGGEGAATKGRRVRLDAVLVGSKDNAARVYAENQGRTCREVGIDYHLHELSESSGYDDIAGRVLLLNTKDDVHAVMVHLPMPDDVDAYSIQRLIAPEKDVEGVNPANIGNIVYGRSSLAPCTALAVIKMLETTSAWTPGPVGSTTHAGLRGKRAVVVGAGDVVGKPIAVMLMRQEATVISCNKHSDQRWMADECRRADIVIAAAGVPRLITADKVRPGAVVIDVGVNRVPDPTTPGKSITVGDVDFAPVAAAIGPSGWISPVPGGVGPMTVAMLLLNVVEAAERAPLVLG